MKECCATCRHFEEWYDEGSYPRVAPSGYGWCEWSGDEIDMDPDELTCFDWEPKEDL